MQYLLILVFIWDSQVEMRHYEYAELMACNEKAITFTQEAIHYNRSVLVAACYPISKTWNF